MNPARHLITENARVVALTPGLAWVEIRHRHACSGCDQSAACGTALLGRLFSRGVNRFAVANTLDVQVGDPVVIGIADSLLVRAALIAYLLPILALIAGAGLAQWLGLAETPVALAGLAGLGAGLWLMSRLAGGAKGRQRYRPRLLQRDAEADNLSRCTSTLIPPSAPSLHLPNEATP